jgi:hypothetical protein
MEACKCSESFSFCTCAAVLLRYVGPTKHEITRWPVLGMKPYRFSQLRATDAGLLPSSLFRFCSEYTVRNDVCMCVRLGEAERGEYIIQVTFF